MFGLIIGGIICLIFSFFGFYIKKKYKVNADFLSSYLDFLQFCLIEIQNSKTPIYSIIEKFVARENTVFSKTLLLIKQELKSNSLQFDELPKDCMLVDKNKVKMVVNDLSDIGKYDSITEINKLKTLKEQVANDVVKAVDKYKKDGVMAFKLSVLLGVAIMIIFA